MIPMSGNGTKWLRLRSDLWGQPREQDKYAVPASPCHPIEAGARVRCDCVCKQCYEVSNSAASFWPTHLDVRTRETSQNLRRKINLMQSYVHICVPTIPRLLKRRVSSFGLCQSCCQKSAARSCRTGRCASRFGLCNAGSDYAKLVENMCEELSKNCSGHAR